MSPLLSLLRDPTLARDYTSVQWALVLESGLKHQLLGQLGACLTAERRATPLPIAIQRHLSLAMLTSQRRVEAAAWEINSIRNLLPANIPITLLKGVAYSACKDANAAGRTFSDIDILVPKTHLDTAEATLFAHGWRPGDVDEYDRQYYRNWMHELPPMTHIRRQTVLDLHHAIIPVISRYNFPADLLLSQQTEIAPGLFTLSPYDRVIHCAVHAVIEGGAGKVLKDLYDVYQLRRQHAALETQLRCLLDRAAELGLEYWVLAAIDAANRIFNPSFSKGAKTKLGNWLVSAAYGEENGRDLSSRFATAALLGFSHWIKMPMHILIPHLVRKSIKDHLPKITGLGFRKT